MPTRLDRDIREQERRRIWYETTMSELEPNWHTVAVSDDFDLNATQTNTSEARTTESVTSGPSGPIFASYRRRNFNPFEIVERGDERVRENQREQQDSTAEEEAARLAETLDWSEQCQCDGCYASRQRRSRTFDPFSTVRRVLQSSESVRNDEFFICATCRQSRRRRVRRSDGRSFNNVNAVFGNHIVCRDCYQNSERVRNCGFCQTSTIVEQMQVDSQTGQNWCQNCINHYGTIEGQRRCRRCDVRYSAEEIGENGECRDCQRRNLIRPYDANVLASCRIIGEPKDRLYFGVELEVEATNVPRLDAAEKLQESIEGFGILKRDGSLSDDGIEIVSTPIAFDEYYSGMWDRFFDKETTRGLRSFKTDTCGMHVHVSRAPLTKLQIGKMIAFIHNPNNSEFVAKIAQRPSNYYGDFSKFKTETEILRDVSDRNNRYTALNLRNPSTVEFRIFKGTINRDTFFKNLEFCHALVKFCGGTSRSMGEAADHRLFGAYVFQERKRYPHLWAFMVRNKMVPEFRNVYELKDYIKKVSKEARKTYLNERAKNRLVNGLSSVRSRDMDYYRGLGGYVPGRINSTGIDQPNRITEFELYDILRNNERDSILSAIRNGNITLNSIPTPETEPEANVWGSCPCDYCSNVSERQRDFEQGRLEEVRARYHDLCVPAGDEEESNNDWIL